MLYPLGADGVGASVYDLCDDLEVDATNISNYIRVLREMGYTVVVNAAGLWIPRTHWSFAKRGAERYWKETHGE